MGTVINDVGVADGGATDDSVIEIGVGVSVGCSTTSDFSGDILKLTGGAGGISST